MTKEQYLKMRNELLAEVDGLINSGDVETANAKMTEVTALDNQFEAERTAQANVAALRGAPVVNIEARSIVGQEMELGQVFASFGEKNVDEKQIYTNAWAKAMQGVALDEKEQNIFDSVNVEFSNAYTHDTGNTSVLIPETVVAGIWTRAAEMYPLLADVKKFNVKGTLTMKKHASIDAGDAAFYADGTATADEQNTFAEITLSGCELSKAVTISWKLRSMAIAEFIPFITNELGERVGAALGSSVSTGKGSTATPQEPQGIETALLAEGSTPQVVSYDPEATTADPLSYADFTLAISKIHSSYLAGCNIYANNATIWTQLANLVDGQGRPMFIPDVTAGGVGRMFGMVVKPDAGVTNGSIIIGNPGSGYIMNTNEPMSVATEEHVKARTVDCVAYTIVDGAVLDTKAFALIRNTPNA